MKSKCLFHFPLGACLDAFREQPVLNDEAQIGTADTIMVDANPGENFSRCLEFLTECCSLECAKHHLDLDWKLANAGVLGVIPKQCRHERSFQLLPTCVYLIKEIWRLFNGWHL